MLLQEILTNHGAEGRRFSKRIFRIQRISVAASHPCLYLIDTCTGCCHSQPWRWWTTSSDCSDRSCGWTWSWRRWRWGTDQSHCTTSRWLSSSLVPCSWCWMIDTDSDQLWTFPQLDTLHSRVWNILRNYHQLMSDSTKYIILCDSAKNKNSAEKFIARCSWRVSVFYLYCILYVNFLLELALICVSLSHCC